RRIVFVHACNTVGSWGAGIALAFKDRFPAQFEVYRDWCMSMSHQVDNISIYIACLFTSQAYGRRKDSPEQILAATREALGDLERHNGSGRYILGNRFNSGRFGVPWEGTAAIVEELGMEMTVYAPLEEEPKV
ncbi:hypothetical protein BT96DRAFT_820687, partial [Gymnopus androsaceus JB14]